MTRKEGFSRISYVLTTSEIKNGRIYSVLLNIDKERMIEVDYVATDDSGNTNTPGRKE